MHRFVVLVEAPDRPGLLTAVAGELARLGASLVTSVGYVVDGRARLLLLVDSPVDREALREALEKLGVEAGVFPLGPEAGEAVAEFLRERPGFVSILEFYLEPADLFDALLRLPGEARRKAYRLVSSETLARFLVLADEDTLAEILESVPLQAFVEALSRLEADEAADVLQKLPERLRGRLLQLLPEDVRRRVSSLLVYPPESAGGIMTTGVPVLRAEDTVQDALNALRRGGYEVRDTVVVVDGEGRLVGLVGVDELLRERGDRRLGDLALRPRVVVEPGVDREEAARLMLRYDVNRLPVVDGRGRFLGLVLVEDIADILAEEAAEDIARMGGLERIRERYLRIGVFDMVKARLTWLILIYVIQSVTANILKAYEDLISRVAVVAAFIPLIMDTGGNVGSQAASTIIRALALGEIVEHSRHDVLLVFLKEVSAAAVIGVFMAGLGFVFSYLIAFNPRLSAAVAATLFAVVVFADVVGALLPIVARRLGFDPAAVSAPLVTTIVDISVAAIYMGLASLLLAP